MRLLSTSLAVAAFAFPVIAIPYSQSVAQPAPISIVATASQKFVPNRVALTVGKAQTLRFTSEGGVHGIASSDLGIPPTTITPDKPVTVVVTPTKAGTYKLPCTIVCGPGHAAMVLSVVVAPK